MIVINCKMEYNCLVTLDKCVESSLPYDLIQLINEKIIINNVIGTIKGTIDYASLNNNLKLVKLYHKYNLPNTHLAFDYACMNGNYEILLFLKNNGYKGTKLAMDLASKNGHFHIVKWLHNNNYSCTINALFFAEINNNINILNYLCNNLNDVECTKQDLNIAVNVGNFKIIQFIYNKIYNDNVNFIKYSSKHGFIKCKIMINNLININL